MSANTSNQQETVRDNEYFEHYKKIFNYCISDLPEEEHYVYNKDTKQKQYHEYVLKTPHGCKILL